MKCALIVTYNVKFATWRIWFVVCMFVQELVAWMSFFCHLFLFVLCQFFFHGCCSLWYFVQDKICRNNKGYNSVNGEKSTEGILFLEIVIRTLERKILGVFYSAVKHLLYSQA